MWASTLQRAASRASRIAVRQASSTSAAPQRSYRHAAILAGTVTAAGLAVYALAPPIHLDAPSTSASTAKSRSGSSESAVAAPSKRKTPPGVFLDEEGKPCKVCNSWQSYAKRVAKPGGAAKGQGQAGGQENGKTDKNGAVGAAGIAAALGAVTGQDSGSGTADKAVQVETSASAADDTRPADCPPDVEELGRATWTFLHSTAAYYPVSPSPAQQAQMRGLIDALAAFYPCSVCAADFREDVRANPPDVSGQAALSAWLCARHNEVNEKLGKEVFDCSKLEERWREGWKDGRCD